MVRWYDGLYGGLVAGCAVAVFYALVALAWLHDASLGGFFAEIASGVIRTSAPLDRNAWAIACGVGLHFLGAAAFGIVYALAAERIRSMGRAPYSVLWGLMYGLVVWFAINDLLVPLLGVSSTQPLWEGLVGSILFYGVVISEFITVVKRSKATAA
ncbi:MAG: hypothetical protein NVS3B28_18550 [Candidatus Velthaea sp.]